MIRRIASERGTDGRPAFCTIRPNLDRRADDKRIAVTRSWPVTGRPLFVLRVLTSSYFRSTQYWRAEQEAVTSARLPTPTPTSSFHNLSNEMLADELGHADALLKVAEATVQNFER